MPKTEINTVLTDLEALALSKAVSTKAAKAAREGVVDGKGQAVDFVVRVFGSLNVAEDHETHAVQAAKPFRLLAAALGRLNGVTVEMLAREAEALSEADEKSLKAEVEEAMEAIKGRTVKIAKGRVTTSLNVTPIKPEVVDAVAEIVEAH